MNLRRKDNTEKNITIQMRLPAHSNWTLTSPGSISVSAKKVNTTHDDTADETEEGRLKGSVSAGVAAASWEFDRVVDGKESTQVASAPARGIDRKSPQSGRAGIADRHHESHFESGNGSRPKTPWEM